MWWDRAHSWALSACRGPVTGLSTTGRHKFWRLIPTFVIRTLHFFDPCVGDCLRRSPGSIEAQCRPASFETICQELQRRCRRKVTACIAVAVFIMELDRGVVARLTSHVANDWYGG